MCGGRNPRDRCPNEVRGVQKAVHIRQNAGASRKPARTAGFMACTDGKMRCDDGFMACADGQSSGTDNETRSTDGKIECADLETDGPAADWVWSTRKTGDAIRGTGCFEPDLTERLEKSVVQAPKSNVQLPIQCRGGRESIGIHNNHYSNWVDIMISDRQYCGRSTGEWQSNINNNNQGKGNQL